MPSQNRLYAPSSSAMTYVDPLPIWVRRWVRSGMYSSRGTSGGGLKAIRALLFVSSQKWEPRRCRPYSRAEKEGLNCLAVPSTNSSTRRGVRSSTNSLPEEAATGSVAKRTPSRSK